MASKSKKSTAQKKSVQPARVAPLSRIVRVSTRRFDPTHLRDVFGGPLRGYTIWCGIAESDGLQGNTDSDVHSDALTRIDLGTINFVPARGAQITGQDYLMSEDVRKNIQVGGTVVRALWSDYCANGDNSGLEWLRKKRKITRFICSGTCVRGSNGVRYWFRFDYSTQAVQWILFVKIVGLKCDQGELFATLGPRPTE